MREPQGAVCDNCGEVFEGDGPLCEECVDPKDLPQPVVMDAAGSSPTGVAGVAMMQLDLAEIKAQLAAITPGPWTAMIGTPVGTFVKADEAKIPGGPRGWYATVILSDEDYPTKAADAVFISTAPETIRALVALVEAAIFEKRGGA